MRMKIQLIGKGSRHALKDLEPQTVNASRFESFVMNVQRVVVSFLEESASASIRERERERSTTRTIV